MTPAIDFILAGVFYTASLFTSIQSVDFEHDALKNRNEQYIYTSAMNTSLELTQDWDNMAQKEYLQRGNTGQYRHLRNQVMWEQQNADNLKVNALKFATKSDQADNSKNLMNTISYASAGVGTIFLIKGIYGSFRKGKKKENRYKIMPYRAGVIVAFAY
jgi:hypothetical protein